MRIDNNSNVMQSYFSTTPKLDNTKKLESNKEVTNNANNFDQVIITGGKNLQSDEEFINMVSRSISDDVKKTISGEEIENLTEQISSGVYDINISGIANKINLFS